jgi:hypothetical protein
VKHAEKIWGEIDGAAFGRLRRLDTAQVDGALDLERSGADVDVAWLQREGLARAQAGLGENLEDDEEATLLLTWSVGDIEPPFRVGSVGSRASSARSPTARGNPRDDIPLYSADNR